jgi:hypothetical protein
LRASLGTAPKKFLDGVPTYIFNALTDVLDST